MCKVYVQSHPHSTYTCKVYPPHIRVRYIPFTRICVKPPAFPECSGGHITPHCNTLQHTVTHCNTLQYTATHCNTLQYTAPHTAPHCTILQHATTHTHSLTSRVGLFGWCKGPCIGYNTHGNTLHHTATHCSRLNPHISRHLGRALLYGLREESGSSFLFLGRIKGLFSLI